MSDGPYAFSHRNAEVEVGNNFEDHRSTTVLYIQTNSYLLSVVFSLHCTLHYFQTHLKHPCLLRHIAFDHTTTYYNNNLLQRSLAVTTYALFRKGTRSISLYHIDLWFKPTLMSWFIEAKTYPESLPYKRYNCTWVTSKPQTAGCLWIISKESIPKEFFFFRGKYKLTS